MTLASQAVDAIPSTAAVATTAALVTATILVLSREVLWPRWARVLRSPLRTVLPRLSEAETKRLAYQPDQFPGARDVETPVSSKLLSSMRDNSEQPFLFLCTYTGP